MPSVETRIRTPEAAAYLARLCGHLAKLATPRRLPRHDAHQRGGGEPPAVLHAEHTADAGTIIMTWGQLTLHATTGELIIRADAESPEHLRRIQDMTAGRLRGYGRREHLDIQWAPTPDTGSGEP